jgi:hypothetical protein
MAHLVPLRDQGTWAPRLLDIRVASSYRLAAAAQALAQVTGGHAAGSIVLTP